MKEYKMIKLS